MIFIGAALVAKFAWISYLFGAILIGTAIKMALVKADAHDPSTSVVVRLFKKVFPLSTASTASCFFTYENGSAYATPCSRSSSSSSPDVLFAIDSIPAIFAITADPFLVLTSNIFAILGLRALYFCLAAAINAFRYLKPALVVVLLFVGVKMMLVHTAWKIPTDVSLGVILGTLAVEWRRRCCARRDEKAAETGVGDAEEMR